jgi:hypothetical protein
MAVRSPTLLRILLSLALLGAVLYSPTRATPTSPIPPEYLRRNFSLCEDPAERTKVTLGASAPAASRLKMISEKEEEGDHPRNDASAPLPPVAFAAAPSIEPPRLPGRMRPHLRC